MAGEPAPQRRHPAAGRTTPQPIVARDIIRRGLFLAPVLLVLGGIGWGIDGVLSTGFAIALVLMNFCPPPPCSPGQRPSRLGL